jgi:hypothetical protein
MQLEPRESPKYVQQLEAVVCTLFAALAMVEVIGPEPALTGRAIAQAAPLVTRLMEDATGQPVSAYVRAWLAMHNAGSN